MRALSSKRFGNDRVEGDADDDYLVGSAGNDTVIGGAGNDYLVGTNFPSQGTGERDVLMSGDWHDTDTFVLGERRNNGAPVFYDDRGNSDYAVIQDFDVHNYTGDMLTAFNSWAVPTHTPYKMVPGTVSMGSVSSTAMT